MCLLLYKIINYLHLKMHLLHLLQQVRVKTFVFGKYVREHLQLQKSIIFYIIIFFYKKKLN